MDWRRQARRALEAYPAAKKRNAPEDQKIISAVEPAIALQLQHENAKERAQFIWMVYHAKTHTLQGAALECHYSVGTVAMWNAELLTAVYIGLQFHRGG